MIAMNSRDVVEHQEELEFPKPTQKKKRDNIANKFLQQLNDNFEL
jgi:hypothetical protein